MNKKEIQKGKNDYDFKEDNLYTLVTNRNFKSSIQIGNFILDLDPNNRVIGLEILNASKILGVPKENLKNIIDGVISVSINSKKILIKLDLVMYIRNKEIKLPKLFEQTNTEYLASSEMQMAVV